MLYFLAKIPFTNLFLIAASIVSKASNLPHFHHLHQQLTILNSINLLYSKRLTKLVFKEL